MSHYAQNLVDFVSAAQTIAEDNARLKAEIDNLREIAEDNREDAERWRKCKTMPRHWWLSAVRDATLYGGLSLDEAIDAVRRR